MNSLVGLASTGRALLAWTATMNLWTAALLVGALLLDYGVARRVRASWRVALYAPVALRLLIPPGWSIPLPHAPRVVTLFTPVTLGVPPLPDAASAAPTLEWPHLALLVYVAVAVVLAFALVQGRVRMARALASARPVDGELARLVPCTLLAHEELGPMVVGLFSPRIVLPAPLLATGDAFALASVLRHEASHLERRDAWLSATMQLLLAVAWPVLPLWIGAWRVRQLMELACDEGALATATAEDRRQYGHALLDLAAWRAVALSPITAELHFGSTLRARIEALGWTRRWPLAVQVVLVASVAAGFAACSSVSTSSPSAPSPGTSTAAVAGSSTAGGGFDVLSVAHPTGGTANALEANCAPLVSRVLAKQDHLDKGELLAKWMTMPTDGMTPEQVALCRSPKAIEALNLGLWSAEARNALGQIGKDTAAAFAQSKKRGDARLCPSAAPLPKVQQAPDTFHYQTAPSEWDADEGWKCLRFSFTAPTFFQYRTENDATHFNATARAQHTVEGRTVDVTMILRGEVHGGELEIAPMLEETWKTLD